jgi:hypothetical protein
VDIAGATPSHRHGQMHRSFRGRRAEQKHKEGSSGTWEILSFPRQIPVGDRREQLPAPEAAWSSMGTKQPSNRGTAKRRKTKCGGRGGREL